jgi:hypothetical protein
MSVGASLPKTPRRMVETGMVDPPQLCTSTYYSVGAAVIKNMDVVTYPPKLT